MSISAYRWAQWCGSDVDCVSWAWLSSSNQYQAHIIGILFWIWDIHSAMISWYHDIMVVLMVMSMCTWYWGMEHPSIAWTHTHGHQHVHTSMMEHMMLCSISHPKGVIWTSHQCDIIDGVIEHTHDITSCDIMSVWVWMMIGWWNILLMSNDELCSSYRHQEYVPSPYHHELGSWYWMMEHTLMV